MKRSIFILCLMLQWTCLCYGNEVIQEPLEKYVEMSIEDSDEGSIEELTMMTTNIDARTEATPPIIKPIPAMIDEIKEITVSTPLLMKLVFSEPTEMPDEDIPTEAPAIMQGMIVTHEGPIEKIIKKTSKAIKARLLDNKSEDFIAKSEPKDDETLEALLGEDTTMVPDLDSDVNETNIEIADDETTVQPPTSKKPKKIEIYKTRPNELLRHYVEDSHLRSPVAALIDKKSNPLAKAKKLWKAALKPNKLLDIMVVSYDSEGIKSTYNLTNTRAMMATLDRVREENATTQESKTYYSIIRTGQLIPYDSAIFLSTDNLPNDTEHQQPASMILLKKRIRLYLVIFDDKNHVVSANSTTAVRQTGFLGQLALRTGGDVIYVPNHAFRPDGEMGLITLVVGNRLKPIDSELREVYENELKNENIETIGENEETTSIH